ncbi:CoA transferase [Trinickia symbiotica]|uniref:CoA transferase n=1 Tax=Trinickia symbiotica TaxID=863227 RepID=A0A2T3Y1A6_9BURK|nr:CaiB/BaiF CoA-transferase family protein [Trinickia symbiotica]PTB22535.1 CoA transferase [Trinickia symbiotica]
MKLPLHGIRVLDLSNVLAGPFCGYQLSLMGAEVIKIEVPGEGDLARRLGADPQAAARRMGASFVAVNAGKQSVTLNLKDPRGREILMRMVGESDVLLENFRPGVMDRLELSYDVLKAINPRIVYCAISGFGKDGPLADRPAYDQIIQGMSGAMSVTGDEHSAPLRVGFPISDTVGGITAAFAIAAALVDAVRTGAGRMIDVSMLESTLAAMGWVVSNFLNAGVKPAPMGNQNFTAAPSGTFRTGDGLINIAANEDKQFASLCRIVGHPEWLGDPRFNDRHARKTHRTELTGALEAALASRSAAAWEQELVDAGVPAGLVLDVPAILAHEQIETRRFVTRFDEEGQSVTRAGFRLSDAEVAPQSPAPRLAQHTRAWLERLGYDASAIETLHTEGVV